MLRSLWSGVSGLRTHQLEMDVIGNNIANVNTTAYKSQATGFQDILYQTTKDGFAATDNTGSTNVTQVGLGARMGSIMTNIAKQGSAVVTDNTMDLMINGDAFFVIQADGVNSYSRDGSFTIDEQGYLVTRNNGYFVRGVQGTGGITDGAELSNLRVVNRVEVKEKDENGKEVTRMKDIMPGQPTSVAQIKGILDSGDTSFEDEGMDLRLEVFGKDGNKYTLKFKLNDAGDTDDATFNLHLQSVTGEDGKDVETTTGDLKLAFNKHNGDLQTVTQGNNTVTYARDNNDILKGNKDLVISFTGNNSPIANTTLDMTHLRNYSSKVGKNISSITAVKGDTRGQNMGYGRGEMNGISFGTDGSIYASYTNGQSLKKGQIAVAEFSNATGLEKTGDNLYAASLNSGDPQIKDVTESGGSMSSGVLEGSNVDLAKEFTDMITTQRGFQANSKVITTSDEMLQILKGLKR